MEDYLLLNDAGAFGSCGKTELIGRKTLSMNARDRPHARLETALVIRLHGAPTRNASGLSMLIEASLATPPHSVPERDPAYMGAIWRRPGADQLALVVEIADTTSAIDLSRKAAVDAQVAEPGYRVADVDRQQVIRLWASSAGACAKTARGAPS